MTQIWAGEGGRTWRREIGQPVPTHPYLPDTFSLGTESAKSEETSHSCNHRDGRSPCGINTPKPAHPGGQCARDVSWVTQPSHRVASRQNEDHDLVTSSAFFAPCLHFSGCSRSQNTKLSPVILAKTLPWDGCDGEIAERGSSGGLGHPWGSNGSRQ